MARRRNLPYQLRVRSFTRQRALEWGMDDQRLAATDLDRLARGVYRFRHAPVLTWGQLFLPDPDHGLDPDALGSLLEMTSGVLSHQSAAALYGIPVPRRILDRTVHITSHAPQLRSRRDTVTSHRRPLPPADVTERHGIEVTGPERTWLDLASLLRPSEVDDLIVAGDHLIKSALVNGQRRAPLTSLGKLALALERTGRFKGVRLARAALPLVRAGADSPPETRLRLALLAAGLPEPGLQLPPTAGDTSGFTADVGYAQWKIAIQYDGEHHRTPHQQTMDALRDQYFIERGWIVVRATSHDLRDGFRRIIDLVRRRQSVIHAGATAL